MNDPRYDREPGDNLCWLGWLLIAVGLAVFVLAWVVVGAA